uniref:Large ribosomal subunit protein mL44 n=1 Tax=Lynceus sp. MCZ IZ 141354 TaxID=1930659 RepID=A0A9N6WW68_9CRUS|nr:EOG090X0DYO [Lynceus sp. MCZ IZ 141354]
MFKARWVAPTLRELKRRKEIETKLNHGPIVEPRSSFLEWNYNAELYAFGRRLNEQFDDKLLRQALIHKSYVDQELERLKKLNMENTLMLETNDALATEGETLLRTTLLGYLRGNLPKFPEEGIQAVCNHLCSTEVLSSIGHDLGLKELMFCAEYPPEKETFSKSLKSVIAALNQSSGEDRARGFIYDFIATHLYEANLSEIWNPANPMNILQEIFKGKELEARLMRQNGVNSILAVYQVGIYCDKQFIGSSFGETIDAAQDLAARNALERLFNVFDTTVLKHGRQLAAFQDEYKKAEERPNTKLTDWSFAKVSNVVNV